MVPTFSGEGDSESLGASARSYMRQVQAWRRMTRLEPCQQGLVLYQNLAGPAWINAESLNMELLSAADGVEYLLEWVRHHYLTIWTLRSHSLDVPSATCFANSAEGVANRSGTTPLSSTGCWLGSRSATAGFRTWQPPGYMWTGQHWTRARRSA